MIRFLVSIVILVALSTSAWAQRDCPGDCNDDGAITVDEIITGVNIALGTAAIDTCSRFDRGGDRLVTIDEILQAVAAALGGCTEATPETTPTATSTSTTPTPTPGTGGSTAQSVAGTLDLSTRVFLAVPEVIGPLVGQAQAARSRNAATKTSPRGLLSFELDCPAGGSGTLSCSQHLSGLPPLPVPDYTVDLNQCAVGVADGRTLSLDGQVELEGDRGDLCGELSGDVDLNIDSLVAVSTGGTTTTTVTMRNIDGKLELHGDDPSCGTSEIDLRLSGEVDVAVQRGDTIESAVATLDDTDVTIEISTFGEGCEPLAYSMTVDGDASVGNESSQVDVEYDHLQLSATPGDASTALSYSGGLNAQCIGGSVTLTTAEPVIFASDESCARSGRVDVAASSGNGAIEYLDGAIEIDADANGTTDASFPMCHDVATSICPG